jgi:hypothetical protein
MSNLKVRPKQVDFSNVDYDYAKAEICSKIPYEKMRADVFQKMYEAFKDECMDYMRQLDIVKKEYKLRDFDIMPPSKETELLRLMDSYLKTCPVQNIKGIYVDGVIAGNIPYYE